MKLIGRFLQHTFVFEEEIFLGLKSVGCQKLRTAVSQTCWQLTYQWGRTVDESKNDLVLCYQF